MWYPKPSEFISVIKLVTLLGIVPCFYLGFAGTMGLIFLTCSLFLLVFVLHFIVFHPLTPPFIGLTLCLIFTTVLSIYACFWPKVVYIHEFLAKSHIYMQGFGQNPCIHVGFWPKVMYICSCSLNSHIHPPFWRV